MEHRSKGNDPQPQDPASQSEALGGYDPTAYAVGVGGSNTDTANGTHPYQQHSQHPVPDDIKNSASSSVIDAVGEASRNADRSVYQEQQEAPYQSGNPQIGPEGMHRVGNGDGVQGGPAEGLRNRDSYDNQQSLQPNPTAPSYKVFCGGLSFQTDEDKLREYFQQLGTVVDVVIMRDRLSGHPRGFGFVSFAEESVAKDVALRRHDIDGRQVEAKIAIPRNQAPPTNLGGGMRNSVSQGGGRHGIDSGISAATPASQRPNTSHLNKVFVGGLPSQVGEAEFSNYFSQFGEVVDAQVMIDHQTGNSRGFGFISFADQNSVENVVGPGRSSARHEIMGKTVEVKRAEPKGASAGGDRRGRDNYGTGSMTGGGLRGQYNSGIQGSGIQQNSSSAISNGSTAAGATGSTAAAGGAYAGYNYPTSVMEQYGQYYNNPQWQQYYAAMGYNMQQYPQGFNPYTYYQAYMNTAAASTGGAEGENTGSSGNAQVTQGDVAGATTAAAGVASEPGPGAMRGGGVGYGTGSTGGSVGGSAVGSGAGARRSSRRDERYHPYR